MRFLILLALSLTAVTLAYPIVHDEVVSPHISNKDIVDVDKTHGSLGNVITRNPVKYETPPTLSSPDKNTSERNQIVKRGKGTAWKSESLTKTEIAALKEYLEKIPLNGVEKGCGSGRYNPWHGDGKSQAVVPKNKGKSTQRTASAYQTKSMLTSTDPAIYRTIVAGKGQSSAFITYEAPEFESAEVIVKALLVALG
ncbi:hypothetical protein H2248_003503 [Termitomyces sp. 'cryptogamus']|nr:hypothetical protein H2248_003503 [Termitomyces sp. 'cryptogamus']